MPNTNININIDINTDDEEETKVKIDDEKIIAIMNDYRTGDPILVQRAKDQMISQLDGFIGFLIGKHFSSFSPEFYAELYQEGVIGILSSMEKFDPSKGRATTFFTAPIIHEMSRFCNFQTNKSSQYHSQIMNTVRKAINHFTMLNHEYSIGDIIIYTGLSAKKVKEALDRINAVNEVYCGDSESYDQAIRKMSASPEDIAVQEDHLNALNSALNSLDDIEYEIICLRYGLRDAEKSYSYSAISRLVKMPVNQVRGCITRAEKKLKHDPHLASYHMEGSIKRDQHARNAFGISPVDSLDDLEKIMYDDYLDDCLSDTNNNSVSNSEPESEFFLTF